MKAKIALLSVVLALASLPAAAQSNEAWFTVRLMPAIISADTGLINETGTSVSYGSAISLGLGLGYMATDRIGLELVVSAAEHGMRARGGDFAGMNGGSTWIIPTALCLQYHVPLYGKFQPYFGVGLNATLFKGYTASADFTDIDIDDFESDTSVGFAVQAGLNYDFAETWAATLDLKYLDISNETDIVHTTGQNLANTAVDGSLILISLGVTCRF